MGITVGRGDAGPFRLGDTYVRQGVVALVAIGGGADAEHTHGARSSSGEVKYRTAWVVALASA